MLWFPQPSFKTSCCNGLQGKWAEEIALLPSPCDRSLIVPVVNAAEARTHVGPGYGLRTTGIRPQAV